eukprot:SAG31_NODE_373_length_16597_cov_21.519518_6_plen_58_part_00
MIGAHIAQHADESRVRNFAWGRICADTGGADGTLFFEHGLCRTGYISIIISDIYQLL